MKLDDITLRILAKASYPTTSQARLTGRLDRVAYARVNQAMEALGGRWNRKAGAHEFDGDARAKIERAIATGEVETAADQGFFPTPAELACGLVDLANVGSGDVVLEPSAGGGAIVQAALRRGARVIAVERDPGRRAELRARALAVGPDAWRGLSVDVDCDDFMAFRMANFGGVIDRVVMNPPFAKIGQGDHLDHVQHAFSLLRRGGVLVSVLPISVMYREDRRHARFRTWCQERGAIAELPDGSFREPGTDVRTCVARIACD